MGDGVSRGDGVGTMFNSGPEFNRAGPKYQPNISTKYENIMSLRKHKYFIKTSLKIVSDLYF